jgi:hypothetical protein
MKKKRHESDFLVYNPMLVLIESYFDRLDKYMRIHASLIDTYKLQLISRGILQAFANATRAKNAI